MTPVPVEVFVVLEFSECLSTDDVLMFARRKRGEKGEVVETIEDVIVRRLTAERIDELKRLLKDTQEKYRYLSVMSSTPLH